MSAGPPSAESRLTELETRYAFLEQQLEALDRVVLDQGREIDELRAELARLRMDARSAPGGMDARSASGDDAAADG